MPEAARATLIGDVVGSRRYTDRRQLHHDVDAALTQRRSGLSLVRTTFRGPADAEAINAALACRDHLLGSLDDRSLRILTGLMNNQSKKQLAQDEAISASAVSQRASRDGLDLIVLASHYLRSIP